MYGVYLVPHHGHALNQRQERGPDPTGSGFGLERGVLKILKETKDQETALTSLDLELLLPGNVKKEMDWHCRAATLTTNVPLQCGPVGAGHVP